MIAEVVRVSALEDEHVFDAAMSMRGISAARIHADQHHRVGGLVVRACGLRTGQQRMPVDASVSRRFPRNRVRFHVQSQAERDHDGSIAAAVARLALDITGMSWPAYVGCHGAKKKSGGDSGSDPESYLRHRSR